MPELLTMTDVARILHCSKAHVCNAVHGRLEGCTPMPAIKFGRRLLIRRETLEHWITENESGTLGVLPERGTGKRA
jgi:excisionase family DNA binding protein